MLEVYIDKSFLFELSERKDKDDEVIYDFIHFFLKKLRGIKLTVNTTMDELVVLSDTQEYFSWLLEINPSLRLKPFWTQEIYALSSKPAVSKLFLLANTYAAEDLEQQFGYLYITNRNLRQKWEPVRIVRDQDFISANMALDKRYWKQLTGITHPFNKLLLFDNYALSNKANQRLEDNLIPFLEHLFLSCCSFKNTKEVAILSSQVFENEKGLTETQRIQKAYQVLKDRLPAAVSIEVVKYEDTHVKVKAAQKEHDRFLFTNYLYLEAGSGFCVYDDKGEPKSHLKVSIRSIFKNNYREIMEETLKNLSAYTATLKEEVKIYPPLRAGEPVRKILQQSYFPSKSHCMVNYKA